MKNSDCGKCDKTFDTELDNYVAKKALERNKLCRLSDWGGTDCTWDSRRPGWLRPSPKIVIFYFEDSTKYR